MTTAKSCPFCGCTRGVRQVAMTTRYGRAFRSYVECKQCYASVPGHGPDDALSNWNNRTQEKDRES